MANDSGAEGATLSEGHEEFIRLLCPPAHELQAETMAELGAFVCLPTEAVSNVGHIWEGSRPLLGVGQSRNLTRGTKFRAN